MSDIFLSYASADQEAARAVADALRARGWSVWWDRVIPVGSTWAEVIEAELDAAACVVVLWSTTAVASHWVQAEAAEGMRRGLLAPALIEAVRLPLEFRRVQAADLSTWRAGFESGEFARLVESVTAILASTPRPGPQPTPQPTPTPTPTPLLEPTPRVSRARAFALGALVIATLLASAWVNLRGWSLDHQPPSNVGSVRVASSPEGSPQVASSIGSSTGVSSGVVAPTGVTPSSASRRLNYAGRYQQTEPAGGVVEVTQLGDRVTVGDAPEAVLNGRGEAVSRQFYVQFYAQARAASDAGSADFVSTTTWRLDGPVLTGATIHQYRQPFFGHEPGTEHVEVRYRRL